MLVRCRRGVERFVQVNLKLGQPPYPSSRPVPPFPLLPLGRLALPPGGGPALVTLPPLARALPRAAGARPPRACGFVLPDLLVRALVPALGADKEKSLTRQFIQEGEEEGNRRLHSPVHRNLDPIPPLQIPPPHPRPFRFIPIPPPPLSRSRLHHLTCHSQPYSSNKGWGSPMSGKRRRGVRGGEDGRGKEEGLEGG